MDECGHEFSSSDSSISHHSCRQFDGNNKEVALVVGENLRNLFSSQNSAFVSKQ